MPTSNLWQTPHPVIVKIKMPSVQLLTGCAAAAAERNEKCVRLRHGGNAAHVSDKITICQTNSEQDNNDRLALV